MYLFVTSHLSRSCCCQVIDEESFALFQNFFNFNSVLILCQVSKLYKLLTTLTIQRQSFCAYAGYAKRSVDKNERSYGQRAACSRVRAETENRTDGRGDAAATIGVKKYRLIFSEQRIITISDSALEVEEDEALSAFVKTVMAVTFPDYFVNIDPCDVLHIVNGADCHVVSFALETEDIPGQLAAKLPENLADAKRNHRRILYIGTIRCGTGNRRTEPHRKGRFLCMG